MLIMKRIHVHLFIYSPNRGNKIHPKSQTFKNKLNQSYNISKENVYMPPIVMGRLYQV